MWYKASWIPGLFAAFDAVWPGRNHDQDGTIGDAAHQGEVSGHNPDDTPGVQAERQDADTRPEVRAADVDARGVDMDAAVAAVLADRSALALLIYIIWNGHIWRASNGWAKEVYTKSDQHTTHAHFSGHPDADATAYAWACIRNVFEEDSMGASFGPVQLLVDGYTALTIPPVNAGLADPRMTWLNVGADTNDVPYALRIWASDGGRTPIWKPVGSADGVHVINSGEVYSIQLDTGVRLLSISRQPCLAGRVLTWDEATRAGVKPFAGSISACFERK